ncbi:MAG: alkaline phosphatase family protein [Herpetosiphonaceae bacterium]|nr:alkaline phosphatase family protein [Herpetosiphonaceae bacterium]
MTQRMVLLGLDSASWNLLDPWINQGLLPNIAALRARSAWGDLESTIHPITASAWVSLLTGKNPGKHGIYDFTQRRPGTYALAMTNASMIHSNTIYDWLSDADKRVISINMPYTFPPKPINGKIIGGLFAPAVGPGLTYPASLWEEVKQVAPRYTIAPDYSAHVADPLAQYIADMHDSVEQRTHVAEWLIKTDQWDLFTLIYTECDEIQHAFWHCLPNAHIPAHLKDHPARYGNPIRDLYQHIDACIGRVLGLIDPTIPVWTVSDHGGHELKYWVNLNRWLTNEGLLAIRDTSSKQKPVIYSLARVYKRYIPTATRRKVSAVLGQRFEKVKAHLQTKLFSEAIDWPRTKVYALGSMGSLYINLRGREPQGIVEQGDEYEALCTQLIEKLEQFVDPATGTQPIARVLRRRDVYHGAMSEHSPDLIIIWQDLSYCGRGSLGMTTTDVVEPTSSSELSDLPLTGVHDYNGIFMLQSALIPAGRYGSSVHIQDIAPSLLHTFGLPIPEDIDGEVLYPLTMTQAPIEYTADEPYAQAQYYDLTEDETALVEKRLSDLGYM